MRHMAYARTISLSRRDRAIGVNGLPMVILAPFRSRDSGLDRETGYDHLYNSPIKPCTSGNRGRKIPRDVAGRGGIALRTGFMGAF